MPVKSTKCDEKGCWVQVTEDGPGKDVLVFQSWQGFVFAIQFQ
jgi:hypothetical protein